jgi:dTDP-4-dehydrorhamnose 3,5-epimerase-like enzyme
MKNSFSQNLSIGEDCIISPAIVIEHGVVFGHRVIADADGIRIGSHAKIDSGSIIAGGVSIGSRAWVRSGSVVLSSVPSNAIVEGNPAQVVGYQSCPVRDGDIRAKLIDFHSVEGIRDRPCKLELGVGDSSLYFMRQVSDPRGFLTVGEVPNEVPFEPKRYFTVYNVPSRELRGEHAHKECKQFLLCVNGSCRVLLDDGVSRCEVILDRPDMAVYMPAMIWGTQYRYSHDAVLLVFASMHYNNEDYIRTYEEFIDLI